MFRSHKRMRGEHSSLQIRGLCVTHAGNGRQREYSIQLVQ